MKDKTKILVSLITIFVVMYLIPMIGTRWVSSENGFGFILLSFFIFNPIVSIVLGVLSGTDVKKLWWIPLFMAFSFPVWMWLILEDWIFELYVYSAIYLALGLIAMLLVALIQKKR